MALATGCATGGLKVETGRLKDVGDTDRLDLAAIDGGFTAEVVFMRGSGSAPKVLAEVIDEDTIELRFDYRPGLRKCASRHGYRVDVTGMSAGRYEVIAKSGSSEIATATVVVSSGTDPESARIGRARMPGSMGC